MNYCPRLLYSHLIDPASAGKIHIIFGARQTGKSTLMRKLAAPNSVFINLQDRSQRLDLERDPIIFTRQLKALDSTNLGSVTVGAASRRSGRMTDSRDYRGWKPLPQSSIDKPKQQIRVIVDEIQRVPELLNEVQYLYDEFPGRFEFFLTGSSARRLKVSSSNLLPGRSHLYRLCPLMMFERRDNHAGMIFPLELPESFNPLFPSPEIEELLLYGNLPGVVLESKATRVLTLESYVELYLEEEIRREALVRNIGAFQQFLELAAMESGKIINLTALSQESGVAVSTLRTYYQVLEDTFVGYRIPAFGWHSRKKILRTPKFLFFDTGVRNAAARLGFTDILLKTQAGQLFENWVGLELMHRCLLLGRTYRLSFWRTAQHAEVDYVLETPGEVIPIEVKWTVMPHESDARYLKQFLKTYPDRSQRGFIICRCSQPQQIAENITAIPWGQM